MKNTRKMVFMAILTSLSVVLGIVDAQISSFVAIYGVKIGLANIIIILSILYFSFTESFAMALLKSLLISLMLGVISTFLIGFTGTMFSYFGMMLVIKLSRDRASLILVSVVGGILHATGQLIMAGAFYNFGLSVIGVAPQLLLISTLTGVVTGKLTTEIRRYVDRTKVFEL